VLDLAQTIESAWRSLRDDLLMHKAADLAGRRDIDLRFLRWGRQRRGE
jgi:hypothetical protein